MLLFPGYLILFMPTVKENHASLPRISDSLYANSQGESRFSSQDLTRTWNQDGDAIPYRACRWTKLGTNSGLTTKKKNPKHLKEKNKLYLKGQR
ncbi:hypothetical protein RRG08_000245 [Elysia crispata]|uniref:Uncharacterized protein n=1 Tax=Elysia crispata TaxID=231223 RepID=A0AAE0Y8K9_9GAST|nr:hypothetical protein RRG08_000245 [Elysia crispata]